MAEGWCRHLKSEHYEVYSAGIETYGLNLSAVKVMAESGVDISTHRSQLVDKFDGLHFATVVTVCGHAHENCPYFPNNARVVHFGFDDPPKLAKEGATEEEVLDCFRRVRDDIRAFVETLPEALG